jgi:hypothetical protein
MPRLKPTSTTGDAVAVSNTPHVGERVYFEHPDMWYFDKLPPTAREALANSKYKWSSGSMYNLWKKQVKGFKTGRDIARSIRNADKRVKPFCEVTTAAAPRHAAPANNTG